MRVEANQTAVGMEVGMAMEREMEAQVELEIEVHAPRDGISTRGWGTQQI